MDNEKMNGIELTDKDLEQVNGGQVSEECAKEVKETTDPIKKLQSKVITSAGTMSVMIEMGKEGQR